MSHRRQLRPTSHQLHLRDQPVNPLPTELPRTVVPDRCLPGSVLVQRTAGSVVPRALVRHLGIGESAGEMVEALFDEGRQIEFFR